MVKKAFIKVILCFPLLLLFSLNVKSQETDSTYKSKNDTINLPPEDTIYLKPVDTVLRIKNFTPYFTLHVDSTLDYHFEINKNQNLIRI